MNSTQKHLIGYGAAAIALLLLGFCWLRAHDAWKDFQGDLKASQVKIQSDNKTVSTAQTSITKDYASNQKIDDTTARKLEDLQRQLNGKPDSAEIRNIVQNALPGVKTVEAKDAQGNPVLAVADTQANRDAINKADVAYKSCRFELDSCEQKQKNFLDVISAKDQQITAKDDTIKTLKGNLAEAQKVAGKKGIWSRAGEWAIRVGIAYGAYKAGEGAGKK